MSVSDTWRARAAGGGDTTAVKEAVVDDLRRHLCAAGGWRLTGPLARGRNSQVFRATSPHWPRPVAVKIYNADVSSRRAEFELRALKTFSREAVRADAFGVPRPYGIVAGGRALAMEWVALPSLATALLRAHLAPRRRLELVAAAAGWLAWFHRAGSDVRVRGVAGVRSADRQRARADRFGILADDAAYETALGVLQRGRRRLRDCEVGFAPLHGDFAPHNLLHGQGRTVGLDFAGRRDGVVLLDVARFLVALWLQGHWRLPSGGAADIARQPVPATFLRAYAGDDWRPLARHLPYFLLHDATSRYFHAERAARQKPFSRDRIVYTLVRLRLRRLMLDLARHLGDGPGA